MTIRAAFSPYRCAKCKEQNQPVMGMSQQEGVMPLEEAVHPRVLRETEAPLEQEPIVWVPVSMNVLLWVLCVAVLGI